MKVFLFLLFSVNGFASTLECELKFVEETKKFQFTPAPGKSKKIDFKSMTLMVWGVDDLIFLKFKGGEQKNALTTSYSNSRKDFSLEIGRYTKITCGGVKPRKVVALDKNQLIEKSGDKLVFHIQKYLTFPFRQAEEVEQMRTIFFQNGQTHEKSDYLDKKLHWCSLRVRIHQKQSTFMDKGDQFKTIQYNNFSNNDQFVNHSFSFVDFGAGKKTQVRNSFSPFNFQCSIIKGVPFTFKLFNQVTGDYFKLKTKS